MSDECTPEANEKRLKAVFDVALQTRNLEISLLWQRSLFFWGFISAAFVAYAAVLSRSQPDYIVAVAISCFGALCSLTWTLANRGSKYWQQSWEAKLAEAESRALKSDLFSAVYRPDRMKLRVWGQWSTKWHFSVSRLAIALSDLTFLVWILLTARVMPGPKWAEHLDNFAFLIIPFFAILYAVFIFFFARSEYEDSISIPKDPAALGRVSASE